MSEPALKIVETTEVETKAISIVDQAKAVKVVDTETYLKAGALWGNIKDMIAEVKAAFDPICDAAFKTHKAATKKRSEFLDPLEAAYKSVKGLMSDYDAAQERIRLAEQRRLEEIEKKKEEDRRLAEAIEAEKAGQKEEATAILEEPVSVAPVVVPKSVPKMAGGPVYRTIWDFEIIVEKLIPREYMMPDLVKIRGIVTALKEQTNIPGIRCFSKRV